MVTCWAARCVSGSGLDSPTMQIGDGGLTWEQVAGAAAKWERGIGYFVKVRLIGEEEKAERAAPMDTDRNGIGKGGQPYLTQ